MYSVEVSPAAERDLSRLRDRIRRQDWERLCRAVESLAEEPRPSGVRKIRGEERAYHIRVGDYRIVYDIYDGESLVVVLRVGRRTETTYRRI